MSDPAKTMLLSLEHAWFDLHVLLEEYEGSTDASHGSLYLLRNTLNEAVAAERRSRRYRSGPFGIGGPSYRLKPAACGAMYVIRAFLKPRRPPRSWEEATKGPYFAALTDTLRERCNNRADHDPLFRERLDEFCANHQSVASINYEEDVVKKS